MSSNITDELKNHLKKFQAAPFMFIGSGFSRRYISLDTWADLLRRFANELGQPFEYYSSKVGGDLPKAASLVAHDYHEHWWKAEEFTESRRQFSREATTEASPLKLEIARYILSRTPTRGSNPTLDREIDLLRKVHVDGIITTNWDIFLESIFPDFKVFIGQSAIISSQPQGVAEIYKIHGCATQPNSLVLTQDDYHEFNTRNPYLAAKLLTIFVEHPVVFFGYSLSDENIINIVTQLAQCLSGSSVAKLQDKLIFVQRDKDNRGDSFESTLIPTGSFNIPVSILRTNDFAAVFSALGEHRRKFSARLVRQMKEHIYELVKTNDPLGKMFVLDLDKASDISEVEVIYGIGISEKIGALGYMPIQAEDLLQDVVTDAGEYDAHRIVDDVLPRLLKGNRKYVPIFKYLSRANKMPIGSSASVAAKIVQLAGKQSNLASFHPPAGLRKGKPLEIQQSYSGVSALVAQVSPEQAIFMIPLLEEHQLSPDELKEFILNNLQLIHSDAQLTRTYFRSIICLYDWLVYGRVRPNGSPTGSEPLSA